MKTVCLLIFGVVTGVSALVTAYHVDPRTAAMSGKARPDLGISEVLTVNFDEPITASLFCGSPGAGGSYNVDIYAYPDGTNPWAYAHNVGGTENHQWLTCSLDVVYPDSFIKGRRIEVRWTRGGADSLEFYWAEDPNSPTGDGPYHYGHMIVGGQVTAA
jgi:hypothetical protein